MTAAVLVVVLALLVVELARLGMQARPAPEEHPDRIVQAHVRSRVAVNSKTGDVFTGLLADADLHAVVLMQATTETGDEVDGQLVILRSDIACIQFL